MNFFKQVMTSGNSDLEQKLREMEGKLSAIDKSQAVIEFNPDGTIITANANFLSAVGYRLDEIQGQHHRMFVGSEYGNSREYAAFWDSLNRGEFQQGEFERFNKQGESIWIQATYNPIVDETGRPYKVVKFASDITAQKMLSMDSAGKIAAISRAQAVIEFTPDGSILTANDNFLATVGYSLDEIQGQHHRLFVKPEYANSNEYRDFWKSLAAGEFKGGEFERVGKDGGSIWIQATYNPIFNEDGSVRKVVKFATNITDQKMENVDSSGKIAAINRAQAVIEFTPEGETLTANENFLATLGYSLDEIQGKHHRLFVKPEYANSNEYSLFWQSLASGEFKGGEFERVGKDGNAVWIQATYNPILNEDGSVLKVVKFATNITEQKLESIDFSGKVAAISRAQAMIEFTPTGEILTANENFLATVGYSLAEIQGKHHSLFVKPEYAASPEYKEFWKMLAGGDFSAGEYERVGKSGDSVWIQATYNPIMNDRGEVVKVVKFATNITEQKLKAVTDKKNAQIANALKLCQANVMLADNDMNIVYMNDEVERMLKNRESELKQHLSGFEVDKLIGTSVDTFHQDPSHQRRMIGDLKDPFKTRIAFDDINFDVTATPWMDNDGNRIGTVVEWLDITDELKARAEEKRLADANARVKQALDSVATNAMIADNDGNIIYMNEAVQSMMNNAESDLRKDLPNFDAANLMGANFDSFHKNPAHQRSMVSALSQTFKTEIEVGGRTFKLTANPIFNEDNERLGTVVEWLDRTIEVKAEREIDAIVDAASAGDLSRRVDTIGKEGFFLNLAQGLNRLLGIADDVVNDTVRIFDALAHGNLTRKIETEYAGSFGKLKQDANSTVERLTEIITRIRESASTVATGASEIAQGNADLSKRTESQASSLEETASSMEEMTSAVKQTSENSVHANELASSARGKAQEGGEVVNKAVTAMDEINQASKKISDIIGVIDEIAFQTNLLALNAAVEAARAGEQGRGFAVVAGEVRNLAQRSAGAAKEIKDLIRDSVDKVEAGTSLVNASGKTLNEIIGAVDRVSAMIQEISTAAAEQSAGIDQVNSAVAQMDEMTQQNAALVEEATAAGEAMSGQAQGMTQLMEFFTLGGNDISSMAANMDMPGAAPTMAAPRGAAPAAPMAAPAPAPAAGGDQGGLSVSSSDDWEEF